MNYENLLSEADNFNISVKERNFRSGAKGLICEGKITISNKIQTNAEKACVLAEELGHYYTSSGNIIDLSVLENRKQEYRARLWAYNQRIGLSGIVQAYVHNCRNRYEMADYLDVTEKFLTETLDYYQSKYGTSTKFKEYIINFYPYLYVTKMA